MQNTYVKAFTAVVICLRFAGCGIIDADDSFDIENELGTIKHVYGSVFLITADDPPRGVMGRTKPFYLYPKNLPAEFQENGLRVVFSANIEECPERADCIAVLVWVTKMRRAK